MNRRISEGLRTRGFLAVSLPDAGPVLTRWREEGRGTKERRGESRVDQFGGMNQIDTQTTVQGR
jgi:hypothetical protein